ncbi:MAG: aminotransferase class III-fold pyridoxal phosphate-dependent enzyme [Holophagales bacterium]|nr:aminotransferase class III-fold pyridoxal phosphate-dependent enzyme [Holophagales bacterium]
MDSVFLRATGDLVCWDDAGSGTLLQAWDESSDYGRDVWLGKPYETVRRSLGRGRMPFPDVCRRCLVLRSNASSPERGPDPRRIDTFQVEPSYHCSLDCAGCIPRAVREAAPPRNLDPAVFRKVLADLAAASIPVRAFDFQGHGEPLMHPGLWELVSLAREAFPSSVLSLTTNAHGRVTGKALKAGLDEVVCAIDGAEQESYASYRAGGRLDLALRFLADFAEGARGLGLPTAVVWKYVLFERNSGSGELAEALRLAARFGVAEVRFVRTRNGEASSRVRGAEDLPGAPPGLRVRFERHEADEIDLDLRLAQVRRRLDEGDGAGAAELALSVAELLARFVPGPEAATGADRRLARQLEELSPELPAGARLAVREAVEPLLPPDPPEVEPDAPAPGQLARSIAQVRDARRLLGYAPVVTGLRPFWQGDGALYPQFVDSARGCELVDTNGRVLLDWMSGYGSVVLGYREPEVEEAVREQLACGPVVPFGHPLELDLARAIVRLVPCAESVAFGKNGSDVLTAAVRIARHVTSREVVLTHGFHGFQDWFAAANPGIGGIPRALRELVHPFPWNDLDAVAALFRQFRGRVAAVVMEPAKQHLPAPGFLEGVRALARRNGALLVFDEIVTGFRFALGGAQELFGVVPDLACFGKALANGWPISVLAGRRDLLRRWPEVGVDMTWRSETLSLAAARCVVRLLEERPVLAHLASVGERLRSGFDTAAGEAGVPARLTGHPSRLALSFEPSGDLPGHRLLETFIDECLKRRVVTNGTLLPNAAHGEREIGRTVEVFREALGVVGDVVSSGRLSGAGSPYGPWIKGCLDGGTFSEEGLALTGWLLGEDGRALDLVIEAPDGTAVAPIRVKRPDVARAHPFTRGAQESGFRALLPAASFRTPDGPWILTLRARRGGRTVYRCTVVHAGGEVPSRDPLEIPNGALVEV